jgi:hypothetical protein
MFSSAPEHKQDGERRQTRQALTRGYRDDPEAHFGAECQLFSPIRGAPMSKAMDTKKDAKKKPAKSLMEKRAAKKEKKANRGFRV